MDNLTSSPRPVSLFINSHGQPERVTITTPIQTEAKEDWIQILRCLQDTKGEVHRVASV